jgi:DNA-binding SARP family transcriptional activator/Tfp pilus assembly protein PilF
MSALQIRLFGGLAIEYDGVPIASISGVTARSLLAYLITYRTQPHTRNLLAGTFWPELSDTAARRRLSQALWQIRSGLDPTPILLIQADTIRLNPSLAIIVDREEFIRHYEQSAGDIPEALEHGDACIERYRGEFLAGYYDDWILTERERLRNMLLVVLGRLVNGYKLLGNYEQALAHARALVDEDPWNEEAHREVMRLCHVSGRSAEAKKQYQLCRRTLNELGDEPSPETESLLAEIARQAGLKDSPWLPVATQASPAPMLERPDRLSLVGRQSELNWLLSQAEAATQGQGGLILMYGEAGVGKTRLLQELARNVEWRGIPTAWGRCYELTGPPAYQPMVEIFRANLSTLNETSLERLWRAELARFLPELATGEAPITLNPEEEQNRLLEAIARGFQALSRVSPYLVILEDAHWMDPASLAAIRYLLPRLPDMPVLMIISAREVDLTSQQAEVFTALENTRLPRRLELRRLDLDETAELVQRCLELEQPPAKFSARLYAETEGNPFFLTETLRTLLDEGLLYRDEKGKWSTPWDDSAADYARMPLPRGVAQSIERRLDCLQEQIREALNLAAVIGRGVSFEVWSQAGDLSEVELMLAADELCKRGLIHPASPGADIDEAPGNDYAFVHDQIRRVIHDRLAPPRLRLYHRRVAEALSRLASDKAEALAYHWTEARVWDKAMESHQQAGYRAAAVYANTDAVDHYKRALDAMNRLPGAPDLPRCYQMHLALEKLYALHGDRQAQSEELAALAQLAETMDDDHRRAEIALLRARLAEITSDFPAAIASACLAVDLARVAKDVTIEAQSLWEWGWALLLQGEHTLARPRFEETLELARRAALRPLEADGLHGLGTICLVTGTYKEARDYFQQVLNISHQVDIRPRAAKSLANLGYIATIQGDHIASKDYNQRALRIHHETGDQRGASIAIQNLADEFLAEGDFTTAKAYYEESLEIQNAIHAQENMGVTLRNLGLLYHQLGDYAQAEKYYQQALDISRDSGVRWYQGQALAYLSLLHHHLGEDQKARDLSQDGLKIAHEINDRLAQGWLLDSLGHALSELGQLDQAADAYQEALHLRQELDEAHKTTESLAGLACIALSQGRNPAAKGYVEEILHIEKTRGLDGTNEPFRIYLTCFRVLEACRDSRAEEILTSAYRWLEELRANIRDENLQRSFLENVAAHREIVAAYRKRQSQRQRDRVEVDLPIAEAPTGRPIQRGETVHVTWTLTTPQDEAIPGKATRRRYRLLRLLEEAHSLGALPSTDHLAEALGVSRRTIERDMKVLRQQNTQLPPTRGKMSH